MIIELAAYRADREQERLAALAAREHSGNLWERLQFKADFVWLELYKQGYEVPLAVAERLGLAQPDHTGQVCEVIPFRPRPVCSEAADEIEPHDVA